ncbi:MAG: hypothetical protein EA377_09605 [Phycisphaerales bacterium]|nr:MAG: hypothetical protein EA377_09605 [Phycisphaerales bacterium]
MAQIEILSEEVAENGWRFQLQVLDDAGGLRRYAVSLAWVDYNHWSPDGADAPAAVAEAALRCLLDCAAPSMEVPERFDASVVRRMVPDADAEIVRRITGSGMG